LKKFKGRGKRELMDGGKKDGRGRGEFRVGTEQSQCVLLAVSLLIIAIFNRFKQAR